MFSIGENSISCYRIKFKSENDITKNIYIMESCFDIVRFKEQIKYINFPTLC